MLDQVSLPVLGRAWIWARDDRAELVLVGVGEKLVRIFEITSASELFKIYPSLLHVPWSPLQ